MILTALLKRFYDVLYDDTLLFMLLGLLQLRLSSKHEHFGARHPQKTVPKPEIWSKIAWFASKNHQKCQKIMFLCFTIFWLYYVETVSRALRSDQNNPQKYFWDTFRALGTSMPPDKNKKSWFFKIFLVPISCWGCMDVLSALTLWGRRHHY